MPQLKITQEDLPEVVRAPETNESLARRNDPRKKDARMGCAAFALAFPGGVTGDDKRRGGAGNPLSCPPEELEKRKSIEREAFIRNQREEQERAIAENKAKMEVEGVKKTIKKKRGKSKSETSFKRMNG